MNIHTLSYFDAQIKSSYRKNASIRNHIQQAIQAIEIEVSQCETK